MDILVYGKYKLSKYLLIQIFNFITFTTTSKKRHIYSQWTLSGKMECKINLSWRFFFKIDHKDKIYIEGWFVIFQLNYIRVRKQNFTSVWNQMFFNYIIH